MRRLSPLASTYTKERAVEVCLDTLRRLGLDLEGQPNIRLDLDDRPQKSPRACVIPSDPPAVVHLITRAQGGIHDYAAFLHEAGHALHDAGADESLPYTFRAVSRDHALTEIYSYIVEAISASRAGTSATSGSRRSRRPERRGDRFVETFLFRRYEAKLRFELEFWSAFGSDRRSGCPLATRSCSRGGGRPVRARELPRGHGRGFLLRRLPARVDPVVAAARVPVPRDRPRLVVDERRRARCCASCGPRARARRARRSPPGSATTRSIRARSSAPAAPNAAKSGGLAPVVYWPRKLGSPPETAGSKPAGAVAASAADRARRGSGPRKPAAVPAASRHSCMEGLRVGEDGVTRCWWAGDDPLMCAYHDDEWGRPERRPERLFELLTLESFQVGPLVEHDPAQARGFRRAFDGFDAARVAALRRGGRRAAARRCGDRPPPRQDRVRDRQRACDRGARRPARRAALVVRAAAAAAAAAGARRRHPGADRESAALATRAEAPRLPFPRPDDRLRVHAGSGPGRRPRRRLRRTVARTLRPRPQAAEALAASDRLAQRVRCGLARRMLTSASSRAARSMRSCCVSARSCWALARSLSWSSSSSTCRVRAAS